MTQPTDRELLEGAATVPECLGCKQANALLSTTQSVLRKTSAELAELRSQPASWNCAATIRTPGETK